MLPVQELSSLRLITWKNTEPCLGWLKYLTEVKMVKRHLFYNYCVLILEPADLVIFENQD